MKNCETKHRTNQSITIPNKRRLTSCMKWLVVVVVGLAAQAGAAIRTSSISFDGVNSYALFANPFYQSQTMTNWSVEMWFKTHNILAGNRASQELWGKSGFWKDVWISFETNGVIGCWYSYPSPETYWAVASGAGVVKNLTWHHVAAVMNGTNLQLFVDGNNVANAVGNDLVNWAQDSGGASTGLNMLGQEQDGNFGTNDRFNGMISEFRIWTKALTQGEIQNNMNKQLLPANHSELVGYWPMGQGSGSTAADLVSTNMLTLYGNAGWTNDAPPISQIEGSGVPTNLLQGLVAYYPFNGNANDASGNGNNLSATNVQFLNSSSGSWLMNPVTAFENSVSYMIGQHSLLNRQTNWTWSAWINPDSASYTNGLQILFCEADSTAAQTGGSVIVIGLNPQANQFAVSSWNVGNVPNNWKGAQFPLTISPGFHHFALTLQNGDVNAGTLTFYMDGLPLGSTNHQSVAAIPGDPMAIALGEDPSFPLSGRNSANEFKGEMGSVRIYNRALSTNEVAELYAIEST